MLKLIYLMLIASYMILQRNHASKQRSLQMAEMHLLSLLGNYQFGSSGVLPNHVYYRDRGNKRAIYNLHWKTVIKSARTQHVEAGQQVDWPCASLHSLQMKSVETTMCNDRLSNSEWVC